MLGGCADDQPRKPGRLPRVPEHPPANPLIVSVASPGHRAVQACKHLRSAHDQLSQDRRAVTVGACGDRVRPLLYRGCRTGRDRRATMADLLVRDAECLVTMTGDEIVGGWVAVT